MTKAEIRREITERKKSFQGLDVLSAKAVKNFQTLETFQNAQTVGAYMPLPNEVDIAPLFQALEKIFYIPAFDKGSGSYRLAKYTSDLKKGNFGIPEPTHPVFAPKEIDLILVPGVAFDRAGHRIGRGGGFYDRLLPQYRAVRVGSCFDFQCLEETIPSEEHDVQMDYLVTETQILKFAMNS